MLTGALTTASGAAAAESPWVQTETGTGNRQLRLNWGVAVKGRVAVQVRVDEPN